MLRSVKVAVEPKALVVGLGVLVVALVCAEEVEPVEVVVRMLVEPVEVEDMLVVRELEVDGVMELVVETCEPVDVPEVVPLVEDSFDEVRVMDEIGELLDVVID
ncbi:hypothetical protein HDU89_000689 [Geranomyces variabilis]|nr:hypothetical protein HDU89_000689 [Geranomyces variabilis]